MSLLLQAGACLLGVGGVREITGLSDKRGSFDVLV